MRRLGFIAVLASLSAIPASPRPLQAISVTNVHGRCVGCPYQYVLGHFEFVSPTEGWSTGIDIRVTGAHVSQWSGVLHTTNGGQTWRPLPGIETYGVDYEPALSFADSRHGWIGWFTASEPMEHIRRTVDGGSRWTGLRNSGERFWVWLHFFGAAVGYGVISTQDGPQFGRTRDSGQTWHFQERVLPGQGYPDAVYFVNHHVGWIAGSARESHAFVPRVVRTIDGGASWQEAAFPPTVQGTPRDAFFLDEERGWMVLWNVPGSTLVETTDGGRTWTQRSTWMPTAPATSVYAVRYLSAKTGVLAVGPDVTSEDSVTAGGFAALVTFDGGRTWSRQDLPGPVTHCGVVSGEVWCGSGMDLLKIRVQTVD